MMITMQGWNVLVPSQEATLQPDQNRQAYRLMIRPDSRLPHGAMQLDLADAKGVLHTYPMRYDGSVYWTDLPCQDLQEGGRVRCQLSMQDGGQKQRSNIFELTLQGFNTYQPTPMQNMQPQGGTYGGTYSPYNPAEPGQQMTRVAAQAQMSAVAAETSKLEAESARDAAVQAEKTTEEYMKVAAVSEAKAMHAAQRAASLASSMRAELEDGGQANLLLVKTVQSEDGESVSFDNCMSSTPENLVIAGKCVQNGTPSVSSPVAIQSVSSPIQMLVTDNALTVNLSASTVNQYMAYVDSKVTYGISALTNTTEKIDINGVTSITVNYDADGNTRSCAFWDENGKVIGGNGSVLPPYTVSVPAGAKYFQFSYAKASTPHVYSKGKSYSIPLSPNGVVSDPNMLALRAVEDAKDTVERGSDGRWKLIKRTGYIASYNGEGIDGKYLSTTGGLDTGASIVYPIYDEEVDLDDPTQNILNGIALQYGGNTVCFRNLPCPSVAIDYRTDLLAYIDSKVKEAAAS